MTEDTETKKGIPPKVMTSAIALCAAILGALLMQFGGFSAERTAVIVQTATEIATEIADFPTDAKIDEGSAEGSGEGSGDE